MIVIEKYSKSVLRDGKYISINKIKYFKEGGGGGENLYSDFLFWRRGTLISASAVSHREIIQTGTRKAIYSTEPSSDG